MTNLAEGFTKKTFEEIDKDEGRVASAKRTVKSSIRYLYEENRIVLITETNRLTF